MEVKNKNLLFFLIIMLCLVFCAAAYAQERLTITTYYPSPYGVYKTLRLFPDAIGLGGACAAEGEMQYSSSVHMLLVCTNTTPTGAPTLRWTGGSPPLPPGTLCGVCIVGLSGIPCQTIDICPPASVCPSGWLRQAIAGPNTIAFCVKQ